MSPQYSGLYAYYISSNTWQQLLADRHDLPAPQPRVSHSMLFHPVSTRTHARTYTRTHERTHASTNVHTYARTYTRTLERIDTVLVKNASVLFILNHYIQNFTTNSTLTWFVDFALFTLVNFCIIPLAKLQLKKETKVKTRNKHNKKP